jgi:hypothetical protein
MFQGFITMSSSALWRKDEKPLEEDVFETDYDFCHRIGQNRAKHRARPQSWRCGWGIHWIPQIGFQNTKHWEFNGLTTI